jgi:hypothetical protein
MKRLFIDDSDLARIDNLARVLHRPQKFYGNAVVRPDQRWDNVAVQIRTTPAWDPESRRFHMIYLAAAEAADFESMHIRHGWAPEGGDSFTCYTVSEDGVNWEKPSLGLHDYEGLTWRGEPVGAANNIVPSAKGMLQGPIYDATDPDSSRRFKGMRNLAGKLQATVSEDCVNWHELEGAEVPSSDEANLTHDVDHGRFIATPKQGGPYGRSFYLSTSEDFHTWSELELIFHADQQDQENGFERVRRFLDDPEYLKPVYNRPEEWRTDVYNFPVFPYEGLYLGLPVMHHWLGKHPPGYENVDSRKTVELACSRDLRAWERVADRAPFMELSPIGDGSAYDTGQLVIANGPVVRNDELWFYYTGLRHRSRSLHDLASREYLDASAACLARLRMDGFVGLRGGVEWGSVTSAPIEVDGLSLRLNADAWRGRVQVELLDPGTGEALDGFSRDDCRPVMVDRIDERIVWSDSTALTALRGRQVQVRLHLWQAEVFAFWFDGSE